MNYTINADDFGLYDNCSDAIMKAFQMGIIDTTTMVVNTDSLDYAVNLVKNSIFKDKVGLHLNLAEGRALTNEMRECSYFCDIAGNFHNQFSRLRPLDKKKKVIVYNELKAQFNKYIETGLIIHHVDSHHHVHTAISIMPVVIKLMNEYGIEKIRIHRNVGNISGMKKVGKWFFNYVYRDYAYTSGMGSFDDVIESISELKDQKNIVEIMCHPDMLEDGTVVDRDNSADYSNPYGKNLKELHDSVIG